MREQFEQKKPQEAGIIETKVDELIHFVDQVLDDGQIEHDDLRDDLLQKLYAALAISNSAAAADRIKYIEERYGRTEGQ